MPFLQYELHLNDSPQERTKKLPGVVAKVLKAAVKMWHSKFLPKHFKPGAENRYDYAPRTRRYAQTKEIRGKPPLVWSGKARDRLTRSMALKAMSVGKTIARGHFTASNEIDYFYRKTANGPDMPAEMKQTTRREYQDIGRFILENTLAEMKKSKTRKKRIAR